MSLYYYCSKGFFAYQVITKDFVLAQCIWWLTVKVLSIRRRKIRLIKSNAKCRYLKNLPVKGLCGKRFIWPRPLLRPHTPPSPYTTCIQYTYSHKEGGRANQREG